MRMRMANGCLLPQLEGLPSSLNAMAEFSQRFNADCAVTIGT